MLVYAWIYDAVYIRVSKIISNGSQSFHRPSLLVDRILSGKSPLKNQTCSEMRCDAFFILPTKHEMMKVLFSSNILHLFKNDVLLVRINLQNHN